MDFKRSQHAILYGFSSSSMYNWFKATFGELLSWCRKSLLNVFTNVIELRGPTFSLIIEIAIICEYDDVTTIIFHLLEDEAAAGESDLSSIARNSSRLMRLSPVVSHVLKMRSACSLLTFFII